MIWRILLGAAAAMILTACGGGSGVDSIPAPAAPPDPPPPPPPPPSSSTVMIFAEPTVGSYVSVGAWTNGGEWTYAGFPATPENEFRFTQVISAPADQPVIRYSSAGHYEVAFPNEDFAELTHLPNVGNPTTDNMQFALPFSRSFTISGARNSGYNHSEMASWWRPDLDFAFTADFGVVAFGSPTPGSGVPLTGSATYAGSVLGISDALMADSQGGSYFMPIEGTVRLAFDFGAGSLSGDMRLFLNEGMSPFDLGTYAFSQALFSPGSTTYSGNFSTALQGFNFFNGRFTGPNAEETIGAWAVPFQYQDKVHQALGAWIAKRGN